MKKLSFLIVLFSFCNAFAQQVIGGGGFDVASVANSQHYNGYATYYIEGEKAEFNVNNAANSMFNAIIKYQTENSLDTDPIYASSLINEILKKEASASLLQIFNNESPAAVGIFNNNSVNEITQEAFLSDFLKNSEKFEEPSKYIENVKVFRYQY